MAFHANLLFHCPTNVCRQWGRDVLFAWTVAGFTSKVKYGIFQLFFFSKNYSEIVKLNDLPSNYLPQARCETSRGVQSQHTADRHQRQATTPYPEHPEKICFQSS